MTMAIYYPGTVNVHVQLLSSIILVANA